MKRSKFLNLCLTAATFLSAPFYAIGRERKRVDKGFKVEAGKDRFGKSMSLFEGDTFDCKISAKDSDSDLYVFESIRRKKGGPAEHVHYDQDEWWYVLSGEFIVKIGNDTFFLKPGDSVFGPRKVPHAWAKTSEGEARLLMIFQPAGKMEEYFKAASEGVIAKLPINEQNEFRKSHGFERVGPPLSDLKQ